MPDRLTEKTSQGGIVAFCWRFFGCVRPIPTIQALRWIDPPPIPQDIAVRFSTTAACRQLFEEAFFDPLVNI